MRGPPRDGRPDGAKALPNTQTPNMRHRTDGAPPEEESHASNSQRLCGVVILGFGLDEGAGMLCCHPCAEQRA